MGDWRSIRFAHKDIWRVAAKAIELCTGEKDADVSIPNNVQTWRQAPVHWFCMTNGVTCTVMRKWNGDPNHKPEYLRHVKDNEQLMQLAGVNYEIIGE